MNIVADESVDRHRANETAALLLTQDKDFGDLAFRQKLVHHGVLLIRLAGLSHQSKAGLVTSALRNRGSMFVNAFTVISPGMIRIRALL